MGKILKTLGLALSVIMVLGFLQKKDQGRGLPKREWLREAEKLENCDLLKITHFRSRTMMKWSSWYGAFSPRA